MRSEVYVLNYPTFDVTGLDGVFEISGVPAGDVKVTAYSPALGKLNEQRVKIQSGVTQQLKFQLDFSQAEYEAALRKRPEATGTSPAGQAGSSGAGGTGS